MMASEVPMVRLALPVWTFLILFLITPFVTPVSALLQSARKTDYDKGYLEYLPAAYTNEPNQTFPLMIFLHGSGERGSGTPTDLQKILANGPPKLINQGHDMGFLVNGKKEYFIVLSPQTSAWGFEGEVGPFLRYALKTYRIDPKRVYVTGLSMGGKGTWQAINDADNTPNAFAAAVPVCAGDGLASYGTVAAQKHVRVWAFHSTNDTALPYASGWKFISAMLNASADPAPIWTKYRGLSHSATWIEAYNTDNMYSANYEMMYFQNPHDTPTNIYTWMLSHTNNDLGQANLPPLVNAGTDKSITHPTNSITLTGTATDNDGTIVSLLWTKVSGPTATMSGSTTLSLSLTGLAAGTYQFRLTATDDKGATSMDEMTLVIYGSPAPNLAPTANAGTDKTIILPTGSLILDGSLSSDPDGSLSSWSWQKVSGGNATLAGANTSRCSLSGLVEGTYLFRLTVTDDRGASTSDDVTVTVLPRNSEELKQISLRVSGIDPDTGACDPSRGNPVRFILTHPDSGKVTIRILTISGQLVWFKTVDSVGGTVMEIPWEGVNLRNNDVASGIYLVHVTGNRLNLTRKIGVLRR